MTRRRIAALLVALMAALTVSTACQTPPKPPLRVEMWGDSFGEQSAPYVNFFFGLGGKANARTHVFPGTAMCDWFSDMRNELSSPSGFHPQAVVMVFTAIGYTPCTRGPNGVRLTGQALINRYYANAVTVINLFTKAHVPVYFVGTPLTRAMAAQGMVGLTPIDHMYAGLPAKFPSGGLVRFVDAGAAVLLNGHYTDTLPCAFWETCTGRWPNGTKTVVVRESDGNHFCPAPEVSNGMIPVCTVYAPGASRFALAITGRVLRDFRLS